MQLEKTDAVVSIYHIMHFICTSILISKITIAIYNDWVGIH